MDTEKASGIADELPELKIPEAAEKASMFADELSELQAGAKKENTDEQKEAEFYQFVEDKSLLNHQNLLCLNSLEF